MANPPAGWHPDPLSRHAQRYWDGQQWTEHVADQSGNMSTDPLDGGGQQAQSQSQSGDQQASWGTQDTTTQQDAGWGGQQEQSSWGDQQQDTTPSWGQGDTGSDWGGSETTATSEEPAWGSTGTDAATAGAGAAAGAAAASTIGSDSDDGVSSTGDVDLPIVDQPGLVSIDAGPGVVVRHGSVVAYSSGVTATDSAHPGSLDVTGTGQVHVAAGGQAVAVLEVSPGGLTVRNDALLAHSGGLDRTAAPDGIVGYDATAMSGGGWVAVTAPGGILELSSVGGIDVTTSALVAWTSDLDVAHTEDVNLAGHGLVLVSAETT
ncbi:DUF2510 domain-containing protein [Salsipaludibacter albus]|uniref:DUF2510 domain-containing protein n=1 Tax=Salsipaludibacter albus TaxID=2849650 RepID=UPI001EE4B151|nr:DUF2510 domain-containing protein [Salsipaludibacter albus]MBY5160894.1 DUF2510 domain-containing protein [Salsipaludibacter albus]